MARVPIVIGHRLGRTPAEMDEDTGQIFGLPAEWAHRLEEAGEQERPQLASQFEANRDDLEALEARHGAFGSRMRKALTRMMKAVIRHKAYSYVNKQGKYVYVPEHVEYTKGGHKPAKVGGKKRPAVKGAWHDEFEPLTGTTAELEAGELWYREHVPAAVADETSNNQFGEDTRKALKKLTEQRLEAALAGDPDWEELAGAAASWGTYGPAGNLVAKWAATAADNDRVAVMMQMAAQEEFKLTKLSVRHMDKWTLNEATYLLEQFGPGARKFLRAMYDLTQEQFRATHTTHVVLFRGAQFPRARYKREDFRRWRKVDAKLAPISSFAARFQTAVGFGSNYGAKTRVGTIVAARVPVGRILGFPGTGYGCYGEYEMVVLGGKSECYEYASPETGSGQLSDASYTYSDWKGIEQANKEAAEKEDMSEGRTGEWDWR